MLTYFSHLADSLLGFSLLRVLGDNLGELVKRGFVQARCHVCYPVISTNRRTLR